MHSTYMFLKSQRGPSACFWWIFQNPECRLQVLFADFLRFQLYHGTKKGREQSLTKRVDKLELRFFKHEESIGIC